MPREARQQHHDPFAHQGDFNEQLYGALKQAPWWMISIAIHVIVFVLATMLMQSGPPKAPDNQATISVNDDDNADEEEEIVEIEEIAEELIEPDLAVVKEEMSDQVETDNELPFEESLGEDGISDAPFTGPSNNGMIGLGGGAGGAFRGRGGGRDTGRGRGKRARGAVEDALKWLAAHQSPDGGWETAGFNKWCHYKPAAQGPDGLGKALYDPGVTGLALCAFLGAGYTNRGDHEFAKVVAKGLRYLKNVQDAEGCFGTRTSQHFIYNHATAALAMVEAYGMTESPIFKASAQKALDFIALARNPYFAWRYGVKPGENDTSVTGWMMMALKSAKLINEDAVHRGHKAPLIIDAEAFDGVRTWIDKMTDPDYGRTGYIQRGGQPARPQHLIDKFPGDKSESMTGVGILARIFIGEDPRKSEIIKKGAKLCEKLPPKWDEEDGSIDMYYWYYATLGMYQVGGSSWKSWNEALKTAVVDTQRHDTDFCMYKGSWDPKGPWGEDGGRVYSTAILAMCLEVYYRYDRVFGTKSK